MTATWVLGGVVLALGLYLVVAWNRFVAQRQAIDATWSGIDVQLQRRHDLVPNLVETVSGYATHEREVLRTVTEARAAAVRADEDPAAGPDEQARVEGALSGALRRLLAVAEGYPELRASRHFLALQDQLVEAEDRIAAARRLYNLEVQQYNRRVEAVPSNVVASLFDLRPASYFELTDRAVGAPPAVGGPA